MPLFDCSDCTRTLGSINALSDHCFSTGHDFCGCKPCQRTFVNLAALDQHIRNSSAHIDSWSSDESDESDYDSDEEDFYCSKCDRAFISAAALRSHNLYNPVHNWCFDCMRDFQTVGALNQHCSSDSHKRVVRAQETFGETKFDCLFCDKEFGTPSAVAMHIESGCHGVTRHQVTAAVHKLEITPTISINRRLKGSISLPTEIITYTATQLAFNGTAYECYLCHDTFRKLDDLNRHLNSPAHDADEFKCPGMRCNGKFKLISGLIQHIESGACGLARFKEVQDQFESLTDQFTRRLKL